jgi:hypothetical protein
MYEEACHVLLLFTISGNLRLRLNSDAPVLQFFDEDPVCGRKIKPGKLFQRYPLELIVVFEIDFPAFPIRTIGQKLDGHMIIVIDARPEIRADRHLDIEFFLHFPFQTLLRRFMDFDFAPGKFPFVRQIIVWSSPGNEYPVIFYQYRSRHFDDI